MLLKITGASIKKPFKGSMGEDVDYYWTPAEKVDGISIQFGSPYDHTAEVGRTLELPVIKTEGKNGKILYKEQARRA